MINCRSVFWTRIINKKFLVGNVMILIEDNRVTLRRKLLHSAFLTVFEWQHCLTKNKQTNKQTNKLTPPPTQKQQQQQQQQNHNPAIILESTIIYKTILIVVNFEWEKGSSWKIFMPCDHKHYFKTAVCFSEKLEKIDLGNVSVCTTISFFFFFFDCLCFLTESLKVNAGMIILQATVLH